MLAAVMKTARSVVSSDNTHQISSKMVKTPSGSRKFVPPPPPPPQRCGQQQQQQYSQKINCTHDLTKAISLLALCVGIIVKGVSYDNSHWANQDELDVVNNKDHFPIMTSFIDNIKSGKHENCEDPKCRIFFDKYAALQTLAASRGGSGGLVPLRGTVSRGVNRRCERITLMPSSETPLGSSSVSKYEKCTVDKQTEINEFKTIRYLLIASMICDGMGLLNWIAILSYSGHPSTNGLARLFLVSAALCGFIAALLTGLSLGLFAQAVDIFEDARLYLGWPFYVVTCSIILSIVTAITSSARLQKTAIQFENGCSSRKHRQTVVSPSVSIVDLSSEDLEAYPYYCNYLPPGYRTACNGGIMTNNQFHRIHHHHLQQQQQTVNNNKAVITPSSSGTSSAFCGDTSDEIVDSSNNDSPPSIQEFNQFRANRGNNSNNKDSAFRRV